MPRTQQKRIQKTIDGLATNPRPHGYLQLTGFPNFYRVRVGDYRIIYQIADKLLVVTILEVKRRNESTY
ncbi:type II toxin-antitoxin system RelE family toxin [Leptolyngbya sp. 7M]|uniref:type II toxin-antitoxin system RelE family toxin n=1 Tax=Leptolyngbya sp. 7M TaxID=2812896 RepID=UPI001B8D50F2|nr:type II toxin-antitoxin system RelE/ParE family toxin [Leptolyngbya sp. 7M]QYO67504.1 type II toxin-antitoxin system RelE/ParE family toxin [Leptolyngbya sp. 7M]